ncbi:hypothetical protein DPMN_132135 [Dreissena polymorpha]|uniref:Uncharacterized protein n=1 Tax=Dreissena polymorpha TaxID=45954 RepID=A0A9D4FW71_DREPO|nr:hypothetical protein DPMN_132135 [Dreissena polymorpha]
MRNSYINPVKCQECDKEIKSIIGDGWGAILIAGFDKDNNSFRNDVNMFAHAISSKVLPSMCVSTVITIDSATQTTKPVSVGIDDAFKTIMIQNVHTLVFLYSGHHDKKHGFKVGTKEFVSMQHINKKIQECTHVKKVIAFVDCCFPEIIGVKEEQRLIQFNSTASTDPAITLRNKGSPFTKLLVQAFTMKASGCKCALPNCECRIDGPFLTIDSLSDYIERHRQNGLLRDMEPEKSLIKINWHNECIAYNYSYKVAFRFDIVLPKPFTSKHTFEVLATTVNDYDALIQTILFPRFADLLREQLNVHQKSMSHADKTADCLCIVYDTGPACCEEVDNIEKLLLAWNSKRLLCCKLRFSLTGNCHKPSGFFLKNGKPVKDCMHEKKEFELTEMESFIKDLRDKRNKCDTDTEEALKDFISNMSSFIHGCKWNKLKHQIIQIRFIDLFDECTSCVVHLLLANPVLNIVEMNGLDRCQEHNKTIKFFCQEHSMLCCTFCLIVHGKCGKLNAIEMVTERELADSDELMASLIKLESDADFIIAESKRQDSDLNKSVSNVNAELDAIQIRILKLFKEAQNNVQSEANAFKSEEINRSQTVCTKVKEDLHTILPICSAINEHGTPQQKYILSKRMEEKHRIIKAQQVTHHLSVSCPRELTSLLEMGKDFIKLKIQTGI